MRFSPNPGHSRRHSSSPSARGLSLQRALWECIKDASGLEQGRAGSQQGEVAGSTAVLFERVRCREPRQKAASGWQRVQTPTPGC